MDDGADEAPEVLSEGLAAAILGPTEMALFENLYGAYAERARRAALGILHDAHLAADAVHMAFLEMLRYVVSGRRWLDPAEAEAMVVRNTHWAALNLLRRRRTRAELPLESSHVGSDDGDWARTEARALCEQLIARLVPRHRQALRLHFIDGLSNIEAAERLGIGVGTFESRLHRAVGAARRAARSSGLLPSHVGLLGFPWRRRTRPGVARARHHAGVSAWAKALVVGAAAAGAAVVAGLVGQATAGAPPIGPPGVAAAAAHLPTTPPPDTVDDSRVIDGTAWNGSVALLAEGHRCHCAIVVRSQDNGVTWTVTPLGHRVSPPASIRLVGDTPRPGGVAVSAGDGTELVSSAPGQAFVTVGAAPPAIAGSIHAVHCGPRTAAAPCGSPALAMLSLSRRAGDGAVLWLGADRLMYLPSSVGLLCWERGSGLWSPTCGRVP